MEVLLAPRIRELVEHRHLVAVLAQALAHERRADEPGAAADQKSHARIIPARAARIPRQTILPGRHRQHLGALRVERRPRRARRRASHLLARGGLHAAVHLGLAEDLPREPVPGDLSCAREVHEAAHPALEQPEQSGREVARPRGRADLVVDDLHRLALARQPQHRVDEVAPRDSVQPGRAHDGVLRRRRRAPGARPRAWSRRTPSAGRWDRTPRRAAAVRRRPAAGRRRTRSRWRCAAAACRARPPRARGCRRRRR